MFDFFFTRKGSIVILYDVSISNLTSNQSKLFELDEKLVKAATVWSTGVLNATVNQTRTTQLVKSKNFQSKQ